MKRPVSITARVCCALATTLSGACGSTAQRPNESATPAPAPTARPSNPPASPTPGPTLTPTGPPSPTPAPSATPLAASEGSVPWVELENGDLFLGDITLLAPPTTFTVNVDDAMVNVDIPGGLERLDDLFAPGEQVYRFTSSEIAMEIYINEFSETGLGPLSIDEYADLNTQQDAFEDYELVDRESFENAREVPVIGLIWEGGYQGAMVATTIVYVHNGEFGVTITYYVPSILYGVWAQTLIDSIDSFYVSAEG